MQTTLLPHHQVILDRFVEACQSDPRIAAAFLVGSYVKGKVDEHSDLDFYLITTEESYDDFVSKRESFVRQLGEPLFMEDFDLPGVVSLIFPDGSEVELSYVPESQAERGFNEPFQVLLDKKDLTIDLAPVEREIDQDKLTETLRRIIYWFWHELSHFIKAMGRGQYWWAQGQLGALRLHCMNLVRLRNDFSDPEVGQEGYFKIEQALPVEELSPLHATFPAMEQKAMLQAAFDIIQFYKELAPPLAQARGIAYPKALERVMVKKLESLQSDLMNTT